MMNPMQFIQAIHNTGNPMQALSQIARQNPGMQQAMQMMNGKTPAQMEQTVRQIAQQRGINVDQLAQQIGLRLPK